MRLLIDQPDLLVFINKISEGNRIIIDDPVVIAWYRACATPPTCCGHRMLPHGPTVPNRWRCLHCHTDQNIEAA